MSKRGVIVVVVVAGLLLCACAGILGLRRDQPAAFPHRAHVIAGVTCTRCHGDVEKGGTALHLPDDATCTSAGCHVKPHDSRSCATCHAPAAVITELVEARDHLRFDHAKHGAVTKGNCMRCHEGVTTVGAALRPPMATCFRCHDDLQKARRCDGCHIGLETEPILPVTHLAHDGDWLREHGTRAASSGELCATCHTASYCASCHGARVPVLPAAMTLADPMRTTIHRAGFASRHSLEARSDPGSCLTCHTADRCASCHQARGVAGDQGRNPHPAGWVGLTGSENRHGREARRDPASCASCHSGAGEQLCVQCHAVGGVGGNPHPPGWSSRQPMSALPCRLCHAIGAPR